MNVEDALVEQYNADIPSVLPLPVAGPLGGGTLVVEPNGCAGARAEVLRALAAHGRAVSVLLNVLEGLDNEVLASTRKVAGNVYMGHLSDDQKAAIVILDACLHHATRE